jgi:lipopolysaccharide transport system ATP-binding protein
LSNELTNQIFQNFDGKSGQILIHLDRVTLQNGNYGFTLYSTVNSEIADYIIEAGVFSVEDGDFFHTGKIAPSGQGNFYMQHQFDLR